MYRHFGLLFWNRQELVRWPESGILIGQSAGWRCWRFVVGRRRRGGDSNRVEVSQPTNNWVPRYMPERAPMRGDGRVFPRLA